MPLPTFGGEFVFGVACKVVHAPEPLAIQYDEYPGINGRVSLLMGSRGRTFTVTGLFVDTDPFALAADEAALLSFADGIARDFTDTQGNTWPNCLVTGEYHRDPAGPRPTVGGWCLPFSVIVRSLS